jgi:hypothetical protein
VNPSGNVLNDSLNWILIAGTYLAAGGEQYITIGSFIPDNMLTVINRGGTYPFTSYAIEDVWVVADSIPTGIDERKENFTLDIFPNPATDDLELRISSRDFNTSIKITVFDVFGKMVLSQTASINEHNSHSSSHMDVSSLSTGMYSVSVDAGTKKLNRKLIILR